MADPQTTFLKLTKPIVNDEAGEDLWGEKLNTNFDLIDTFAASQGALVEAPQDDKVYGRGTPTAWIETIGKTQYDSDMGAFDNRVDGVEAAIPNKEDFIPFGTAAQYWAGDKQWRAYSYTTLADKPTTFPPTLPIPWSGLSGVPATFPPDAHVHPIADVTNLQASLNAKEPTIAAGNPAYFWAGDKSWKAVPAAGVPEAPNDGAQYARQSLAWSKVTGGAIVSDTAPVGALPNSFWWSSSTGGLHINYQDVNSTAWVQVNAAIGDFLPLAGGTLSGDLTIRKSAASLVLDHSTTDNAGGNLYFTNQTRGRWWFRPGDPETGSNAGGNLYLARANDAGTWVDNPIVVNRATGVVTATGLAPTPTAAVTVGQFRNIQGTTGAALALPAGGTWAWAIIASNSSSGGIVNGFLGGVSAGGTSIWGASAGNVAHGFCWRIA